MTAPTRCHLSRQPSRLSNDGAGSGALVLPGRGKDADGLVVASQTVDTRLDQDEAELGVFVLAVTLQVLADGDSLGGSISVSNFNNQDSQGSYLLDQAEQILREGRCKA